MSAIANGIDLNDDAVSGDCENDIVDGVNVLELTIGGDACANETLIDSLNGRRVEPAEVLLHGSDDGGVGLDEGLEREMGGVDREEREEGGGVLAAGVVDGLDCEGGSDENEVEEDLDWLRKAAEILVGGTGRGGAGDEIAAVVEGLGLRLKGGDVAKSGGSTGDSLGSEMNEGGDEIARERGSGNVMGGVKEYSMGFEVIAEKSRTKTVIDGQGGNAVQDEKEEKVIKIDENVNPVGDNGTHSNEAVGLIKNVVYSGFWKGEAKPYTSHVQERLPDEIPVMEVRAVVTNDFLPRGDFNGGAHVSLGVSTTKFGNQPMEVDMLAETVDKQLKESIIRKGGMSEHIGLVVDLNTYLGNWKHEAGFSIEGSEAKDVSSDVGVSVSNCTVGNDACHVDLGVSNGNRDIMVEERMTIIEMPNDSKKKKVKPAVSNSGFSVNDLVWGKIRSHPWWPGQIFDPSDSSKKAMSYFKKNTFLIAYFGDGTFAWNEASQLKPFGAHFSHMEKQSNTEAFRHAVDCALDEISSRVEFALACPCLSEDLYANIKSQVIVNSGIQAKSRRRNVRDEYSSTASFEPAKLVNYIKEMARYPHGAVDRLEHVISQAQLLSHCHWKGYPQLPEFKMLGGLLDNDAAMPHSGKKKYTSEVMEGASKVEQQVTPGVGKSKSQSAPSRKRKLDSGESLSPGKKERSLSDLMAGNHTYFIKEENESEAKSENKLVSSLSLKKHKVVDDTVSDDSGVKNNKSPFSRGGAMKSPNSKQSFRVGDAIRRVVSQLNGLPPNLKYGDALPEKAAVKKESKEKTAMVEKSQRKKVSPIDWSSSPVEMLSQLCLVAADPLEGFNSIRNMVSFFSDFRDSVCSDHTSLSNQAKSLERKSGGKTRGKLLMTEATASSEQEYVKDSYWTDMIIEGNSEDQFLLDSQNEVGEILAETLTEEGMTPTIDSEVATESSPNLVTIQKTAGGNPAVESEKPMGDVDENSSEELSPTALILKFTDLDSAPSITNLNKIFTRYGPLNESETEVLKKTNRAKVVFKRRSDAETAFSSAGKYSIFGPSLVSYRLKYLSSTRQKSPSPATKRSRKEAV